jgi:tetratricopeptide (TPR) repeat protein
MTAMTPEKLYSEYRYAEFLMELRKPAEAARVLDAVVAGEPAHAAALELRARALFASAQLGRAEQALEHLIGLRPDDGWARMALARTLERQGRAQDALCTAGWRASSASRSDPGGAVSTGSPRFLPGRGRHSAVVGAFGMFVVEPRQQSACLRCVTRTAAALSRRSERRRCQRDDPQVYSGTTGWCIAVLRR